MNPFMSFGSKFSEQTTGVGTPDGIYFFKQVCRSGSCTDGILSYCNYYIDVSSRSAIQTFSFGGTLMLFSDSIKWPHIFASVPLVVYWIKALPRNNNLWSYHIFWYFSYMTPLRNWKTQVGHIKPSLGSFFSICGQNCT